MTAFRAALALAAAAPIFALGTQGAPDPGATFHTRTLANGLEVVVVPNHAIPFATVQMAFRGGAFTQVTRDLHGLPHLLEHMLFQQETRAFSSSLGERMEELEISTNASTDDESVTYYFVLPSKNAMKGIELLSDMMRRVNFDQRALTAEGRVVRGELERRASEPTIALITTADRQLWTDAGWERKNAGGNLLSVQDASVLKMRALHARYYLPNNAALIVAGDVQPDSVFATAERVLGGWRKGDDPLTGIPPITIPPLTAISREIVASSVRDVTFMVRWHGPSVGTERAATYAADLFSGIVNQPVSGTQRRLVETGLFQSVSMSYTTRRFIGPIALVARTTPQRAVAAASALGVELRRLSTPEYFTDEDLAFAQKQQRVFRAFEQERSLNMAAIIAGYWTSADLPYITAYQDSLEARTAADVRAFTDAFIKGKGYAVTVMLSPEALTDVGPRLRTSLNAWRLQ